MRDITPNKTQNAFSTQVPTPPFITAQYLSGEAENGTSLLHPTWDELLAVSNMKGKIPEEAFMQKLRTCKQNPGNEP